MIYEAIDKMNSLYEKSKRYHLLSQILFGIGAALVLFAVYAMPSMFVFGVGGAVLCCLISIIFFTPESKRTMNALRTEYKDTFLQGMLIECFAFIEK